MCSDLLPDSMNAFLDDVETGLCLPILLMMVLCTLQFIFNHTMDIACTLATLSMKESNESESSMSDLTKGFTIPQTCLPTKLKGMLLHIGSRLASTWGSPNNLKPAT